MKELKETPWGAIPEQWSVSTIAEQSSVVTDYVANGSFAALAENVKYKSEEDVAVLIRLVDFNNGYLKTVPTFAPTLEIIISSPKSLLFPRNSYAC